MAFCECEVAWGQAIWVESPTALYIRSSGIDGGRVEVNLVDDAMRGIPGETVEIEVSGADARLHWTSETDRFGSAVVLPGLEAGEWRGTCRFSGHGGLLPSSGDFVLTVVRCDLGTRLVARNDGAFLPGTEAVFEIERAAGSCDGLPARWMVWSGGTSVRVEMPPGQRRASFSLDTRSWPPGEYEVTAEVLEGRAFMPGRASLVWRIRADGGDEPGQETKRVRRHPVRVALGVLGCAAIALAVGAFARQSKRRRLRRLTSGRTECGNMEVLDASQEPDARWKKLVTPAKDGALDAVQGARGTSGHASYERAEQARVGCTVEFVCVDEMSGDPLDARACRIRCNGAGVCVMQWPGVVSSGSHLEIFHPDYLEWRERAPREGRCVFRMVSRRRYAVLCYEAVCEVLFEKRIEWGSRTPESLECELESGSHAGVSRHAMVAFKALGRAVSRAAFGPGPVRDEALEAIRELSRKF